MAGPKLYLEVPPSFQPYLVHSSLGSCLYTSAMSTAHASDQPWSRNLLRWESRSGQASMPSREQRRYWKRGIDFITGGVLDNHLGNLQWDLSSWLGQICHQVWSKEMEVKEKPLIKRQPLIDPWNKATSPPKEEAECIMIWTYRFIVQEESCAETFPKPTDDIFWLLWVHVDQNTLCQDHGGKTEMQQTTTTKKMVTTDASSLKLTKMHLVSIPRDRILSPITAMLRRSPAKRW